MSASPSIDAYDAQMLDFSSDHDVPMNITGAAEFFAEALMDHDGHLSTSTYGEHASVEVDMEEYVGDNAEYEMADETTEYHRPHGDELLDIEVYDASYAASPLTPSQPLQPSVDVLIDSEHQVPTSPSFSEHATVPELQGEAELEVHPAPLDHPAADASHVEPLASGVGVSSETVSSELTHATDAPDESILPISESQEQLGDTTGTNGQPVEISARTDAIHEAEALVPSVTEEPPADSEVAQHEAPEPPTSELAPLAGTEEAHDSGPLIQDEKVTDQAPVTEGEAVDPLHISDGVYIDPPPAVLLSIADLVQPEFVLFGPGVGGESTGESHGNREAYSLLLENRPTLYYEPLSAVFEALRQDEALLSRVPHSFEGELVIDAYDLQLAVSEDNVHSREISLHDLNMLHDGSDFVGPLRLLLRAIVPRFIIRYYALQEQVQRLNVAAETSEGEHNEEPHEQEETGEGPRPLQQETAVNYPSHAVVPSEGPVVSAKEPVKEPPCLPEPAEETGQENLENTSGVQEFAAKYHEVSGEATHTFEDEDAYEGTNADDEDEHAKPESLDVDQVHDTAAEDTDAAVIVTVHGSEFGGEQTEYLDYVQPEEYDERYGEDLPERARWPDHYGKLPCDEEEQDTTVYETRPDLPALDEDEEGKSVATPVQVRAASEPELTEPTDKVTDVSVLSKQDDSSISNSEKPATSESANELVYEHASGNQVDDTDHARIFLEIEKSDSNFVSKLEHDADAEFDQTFNAEQNGQESSTEDTLQHEPIWDEWDDEDAEGEDEDDWIDPDATSNESSVTLSSKASSKRNHEEVDPGEEVYVQDFHTSPGSKRPRVA